MSVVKIGDFLLRHGTTTLLCPNCRAPRLEVIVAEHAEKSYICKIVCTSGSCYRKVEDVLTGGFPVKW